MTTEHIFYVVVNDNGEYIPWYMEGIEEMRTEDILYPANILFKEDAENLAERSGGTVGRVRIIVED